MLRAADGEDLAVHLAPGHEHDPPPAEPAMSRSTIDKKPTTVVKEKILKVEENSLIIEVTISNGRTIIYRVPRHAVSEADLVSAD